MLPEDLIAHPWLTYHPVGGTFPGSGPFTYGPMLSLTLATWLVRLAGAYLAIGVLFALPFAYRWVGRLDPVATHGTRGFRLLIIPGATALWPILLARLLRGGESPPPAGNPFLGRPR